MKQKRNISDMEMMELLEHLVESDALELCVLQDKKEMMIPYIMNDAVECYLHFFGCRQQGELDESTLSESAIEMVKNDSKQGVILRQPSGNVLTIWYQRVQYEINCYQYHRIGHAWRKDPGEEYIRRLVNILCVIHDKVTYLGEVYCSQLEVELSKLAEFPSILYFSPINESILPWYPWTQEGIDAWRWVMKQLDLPWKDMDLQKEIEKYKSNLVKGKIKEKQIEKIAMMLLESKNVAVWLLIEQKIEEASKLCRVRDYGDDTNDKIEEYRKRVEERYLAQGYTGCYPDLFLEDSEDQIHLYFVEEQPFTVMEWEDYHFRIFSMKLVSDNLVNCDWQEE